MSRAEIQSATQAAFDEAAMARDAAGYVGTPADCIRDLSAEAAKLRELVGGMRARIRFLKVSGRPIAQLDTELAALLTQADAILGAAA